MAGSATSAENQCSSARVASPMPWACPAQTATESSMTFAVANPATARARSSCVWSRASAGLSRPGANGTSR